MGLVKADRRIEFTDHVLPICLPFKPIDDFDALENDFVNLAGWGVNPQGDITNQVHFAEKIILCERENFSGSLSSEARTSSR